MERYREKLQAEQGWQCKILLQRHGQYDSANPALSGNQQEAAKHAGLLTPEGISRTKLVARGKITEIFQTSSNTPTDFLFLHSPTKLLGTYGARAQQTAEIATD
ncbi:MAG: hypothetical protein HYU80_03820 [Candidatus Blackburnbacteria bacterium]|nr:hypothetical protein [Candidatus Blackburnbacteria bacterium]